VLLSTLVLLLAHGLPARAQQGGAASRDTTAEARTAPELGTLGVPLLDSPVSRSDYLLGPGDLIGISMFGGINNQYSLRVSPEGVVVVPVAGMVPVLGLSVEEAELRLRSLLARYYRNTEVAVTLLDVRRFKVYLTGDVPSPGVRVATAVTRVSEVIGLPEEDSLELPQLTRRTVLIRRSSGEIVDADLARFRQMGDLSANPTLREGDVVVIPAVDATVQVLGRVAFPGTYQFRESESLADLLRVANGGQRFMGDAADSVRISRFLDRSAREVTVLDQAAALGAEGESILLAPFDAVYVPRVNEFRQQFVATVQGEANRPGSYPIEPGITTVRDLVQLAGGFTESASLTSASLRRVPVGNVQRRLQQLRSVPPELLSSEERRILFAGSQGGEETVVIDFVRLFASGEDAFNQVLQDGDSLIIPERRNEVTVLGAVRQPGIVQFSPGYTVAHYVALAGGYQRNADRSDIVVVKARTTARVDTNDVEVLDPEDSIVVPFRERRNWLALLQTTSAVVTTTTGLVLTFIAVFR
jgi:protein involved in polysaccharide export with SLBB domain